MLLIVFIASLLSASQASGATNIIEPLINEHSIIFIGENHLVAEHKLNYIKILEGIRDYKNLNSMAIAVEFVQQADQATLNKYLAEKSIDPGSENETLYFNNLHRRLSLTNNKFYDNLMRSLRDLYQRSHRQLGVCAINVPELYGSFGPPISDEKLNRLNSLPPELKQEIARKQSLSFEELSHSNSGWDREALISLNISQCSQQRNNTFVFIGANHALLYPDEYTFSSAAQLVSIIAGPQQSIATVKTLQPFNSPFGNEHGADERLFTAGFKFSELEIFRADELPKKIRDRMSSSNHSKKAIESDYAVLFDYFILGPQAHIIP